MNQCLSYLASSIAAVGLVFARAAFSGAAEPPTSSMPNLVARPTIEWRTDYGTAMSEAEELRKLLVVYFYESEPAAQQRRFENESLTDPSVIDRMRRECVAVRVPIGVQVRVGGKLQPLMNFEAFSDLNRRPGVAVIDFVHQGTEYYGHVVSVLPLENGKYYRFAPQHLRVVLDLPEGTLTQRTMIFAVRIHPERPGSTTGRPHQTLFAEARSHSSDQARRRVQGHHNWAARFPRISNLLPRGLRAQEVVAESWPGESILDAAVDCVDCWRQSPGHWNAVRRDQPLFGYDMKLGDNGIWYATGLFGNAE